MIANIREGIKPRLDLELFPEFGCYLIDCIRHQKVTLGDKNSDWNLCKNDEVLKQGI